MPFSCSILSCELQSFRYREPRAQTLGSPCGTFLPLCASSLSLLFTFHLFSSLVLFNDCFAWKSCVVPPGHCVASLAQFPRAHSRLVCCMSWEIAKQWLFSDSLTTRWRSWNAWLTFIRSSVTCALTKKSTSSWKSSIFLTKVRQNALSLHRPCAHSCYGHTLREPS